jgi:hypothetical protein
VETARHKTASRPAAVKPAAAPVIVQRRAPSGGSAVQLLSAAKVSSPQDPEEKEAGATAKKILRMSVPESSVGHVRTVGAGTFAQAPYIQRFAASGIFAQRKSGPAKIQRQAEGLPQVASNVAADLQNSMASGSPLPFSVRRFMEPRFKADFSDVKIHTGDKAAGLNRQFSAQAFTVGNQIFFGKDRFRPETQEGKELIAHELTHTIQQGAAVQRSEEATVTHHTPPHVQRWGVIDTALDYIAGKANMIPGFRMFTIVLGVNPINMSKVDRSPANILRALIEFLPGGGLITQALDNSGVFEKVGNWVAQQIQTLGMIGGSIKQALMNFVDSLGLSDIGNLGGVWERAKRIFTEPIDRIISFAKGLVTGIIQFVKEAILRPLAKLAEGTRGYDLLKAVLGQDPVTGDPVPQTADTLIGGFMKLIGQEEVWNNMKKANAVARAWAWFKGAMSALLGFVRQLPTLFINAFKSLELVDIILVPRAFMKVAAVFGGFLGQFFTWAGNAVWNLLEILFDAVSPGAFGYIKRTGAALKSILKNPLPFMSNLVKAGMLGFQNFAANFGTHLKAGLIDWLTGSLPGIYIPKAFSLAEIVKFVFSVLGLTWQNIRQKLVKVVGEPAVKAMETGFDIVVTLVTQGPAAAWDKIKEQLANLKDMVIGGITDFVIDMVVKKAIPKIIAMFIPGAGFISAILTIYDTIMVFVNKIAKIIQVVKSFIDSIVAIANGAIGAAAARVESTLAGLLALAINFLAGFAGLGKVTDKVMGVIQKVRAPIDKALDWLINWIVTMAKNFLAKGKAAVGKAVEAVKDFLFPKLPFEAEGEKHQLTVERKGATGELVVASTPTPVAPYLYKLKPRIEAIPKKSDRTKALGIYQQALDQRPKAAKTLEEVFRPETGRTKAEQDLHKETELLLGHIKQMWELIGVGDFLDQEGEVGSYGELGKLPEQTAHHVPQDAVMRRVSAWLNQFLIRPRDADIVTHRRATLAGLGVKYDSLTGYKFAEGICIRMEMNRHGQTRTFGKLPDEDLDIPQGTPRQEWVKFRPIHDARMKRFFDVVADEFGKDREDVFAIYSGRKGMPAVSNIQKITAARGGLGQKNSAKWGAFLR